MWCFPICHALHQCQGHASTLTLLGPSRKGFDSISWLPDVWRPEICTIVKCDRRYGKTRSLIQNSEIPFLVLPTRNTADIYLSIILVGLPVWCLTAFCFVLPCGMYRMMFLLFFRLWFEIWMMSGQRYYRSQSLNAQWDDLSQSISLLLVEHENKTDVSRVGQQAIPETAAGAISTKHWVDSNCRTQCTASECAKRFTLTERKHHCRRYWILSCFVRYCLIWIYK